MSATLKSHEPATGALLWEGPIGDVPEAVARVEQGWPDWAALPFASRVEVIRRFANSVRQHEERIADLVARETGRPLWDAKAEVSAMATRADLAVAACSERAGQRRLEGSLGARQSLRHKPHGVMAVISAFALPAQIPSDHIAAALIAGNGVVFKPSEKTPAIGRALIELYHAAGVPANVLQCVIGDGEMGAALVADPGVNGVLFTGSTPTGLAIARTVSQHPETMLALNMGGNNPIIAWDGADLASAAALIVQSAFASSGQHCLAARRLILPDALAGLLVPEITRLVDRLIIDHPHAEHTPYMGPIIDMDSVDGLTDAFLYLMSNGGRPIMHMKRPQPGLPFVTPGIIDVTDVAKRPDIELFGPLLQIVRVENFDDAVAEANASRFGLSASLIGGGPEYYDYFWANIRAGIVNWNRPTTAIPLTAPLGGSGLSGNFRPSGPYAADHCAFPVASSALDQPRAAIGIGLRHAHYAEG